MKKLVILGNGLDLNFGMHTSFKDFFDRSNNINKIKSLLNLYGKQNWYDMEDFIMRLSSTRPNGASMMTHPGVYQETYQKYVSNINFIRKNIIHYLKKEENELEIAHFSNNVETFLKNADSIINFNYTDAVTQAYNVSNEKIYHIHGSLKENFIILGNSNESLVEGIPKKYRIFSKLYLRDILDLRRYLSREKRYSRKNIQNIINIFKIYNIYNYTYYKLPPYFTNSKIYKILCELNDDYDENSKYFYDLKYMNFKAEHSFQLKEIRSLLLERQENVDILSPFLDYLHFNCFKPFKIRLPGLNKGKLTNIFPEDIEEITIIGHSLESDKEIIFDLIRSCVNLKTINIFKYNGNELKNLNTILKYNNLDHDLIINTVDYETVK